MREVPVTPQQAWQAMTTEIGRWWASAHSWSGDAANLHLDARPGGCFCETLPDGGWVEHLRIVFLAPGREIRLQGALGPLMQLGLQGTMTWHVEATPTGSRLSWTYAVHGFMADGFDGVAPAVDGVIGTQLESLVRLLSSA